jgi:uncharacterized protein (DUF362 family)
MPGSIDRRTFLKIAGVTAAGLPGLSGAQEAHAPSKPVVAIVTSGEHAGKTDSIPGEVVARMVSTALAGMGGRQGSGGWADFLRRDGRVAVKVNTLAGPQLSTHPSLVDAIVEGLLSAGVKGANIIVFDRSSRELEKAGFSVGRASSGVRCIGTDAEDFGYGENLIASGSTASLWSRILTDFATAIINVPVLKDHDLSGVSLGMKNFFGAIHNPNKYHDNGCDPYIAEVCSNPLVRQKLRMVVIDGLRAQLDGGPAYRQGGAYPYAGIIMGSDPVAVDAVGWAEIEAWRAKLGHKSLKEAGREPRHILTAEKMGLGTARMDDITVVRLTV